MAKKAYSKPTPVQPEDFEHKQCPVCGHDSQTLQYRKALWDIFHAEKKTDMRRLA